MSRLVLLSALLLAPYPFVVRGEDRSGTIQLPEKYVQFTLGGSGRYVALQLETSNKVVVVDVRQRKVSFTIDGVARGDLLAGSAKKLIVVSPSKMMVRRWDLANGKRDKLSLLEGNDAPQQALLGCAGDGPLLLVGKADSHFYDLESLKPIEVKGPKIGGLGRYGRSVHVSAQGRTFGTIPTGYGPVAYSVVRINGAATSRVSFGGTSNAIRWAQPSGNGYLLMQPGGDIVNGNGRAVKAEWLKGAAMIPSTDPSYVLDVRVDERDKQGKRTAKITVCSTADCRPLLTEFGFSEIVPKQINSWHNIVNALRLKHEWRVQYVAAHELLLTLPASNDRILVRNFNLRKKMKAAAKDFLYVRSTPPLTVVAGKTMNYRLRLQSSAKKVRLSLQDGPQGARLSAKGKLQWQVPDNHPDDWVRFLISATNADGKEIFHSFEIAVRRLSRK